jgi:hypothetical protein
MLLAIDPSDDERRVAITWNRITVLTGITVVLLEEYANTMPAGIRTVYDESAKGRAFIISLLSCNKRLHR